VGNSAEMNESLVDFVGSSLSRGTRFCRRNVAERHVEIPVHVARDNPRILIPTATILRTFELRCLISQYLIENFNSWIFSC